jgi:hypothetical protein
MSDEEQRRAFNASQKPCPKSGKCPRLQWMNLHVIACGPDCECTIHDGSNVSPQPIINAWNQLHP